MKEKLKRCLNCNQNIPFNFRKYWSKRKKRFIYCLQLARYKRRKFCSLRCHRVYLSMHSNTPKICKLYATGKYSMRDIATKLGVSYQFVSVALDRGQELGLINKNQVLSDRMCMLGSDMFTTKKITNQHSYDYKDRFRKVLILKKTMTYREIAAMYKISETAARKAYIKALYYKSNGKI